MAEFYKGERVVVLQGEYRNQHGKINSEMLIGRIGNRYWVSLDNGDNDEFLIRDIEHENLRSDQISAVIKNIENKVNEVASKFPEKMKTELPTHIGYLKDALLSENKSEAVIEHKYITNNLKNLSEQKVLSVDWIESTRIDFEKIDWVVKRLS